MSGFADKDFNAQAYHEGVITNPADVDGYQRIIHRRSSGVRQIKSVSSEFDAATALVLFDLDGHHAHALLWPGRMPGTHVVDFDRVFDVASFRRNY